MAERNFEMDNLHWAVIHKGKTIAIFEIFMDAYRFCDLHAANNENLCDDVYKLFFLE